VTIDGVVVPATSYKIVGSELVLDAGVIPSAAQEVHITYTEKTSPTL
jgi:hypothetical protein